jgi:hypothetical protein
MRQRHPGAARRRVRRRHGAVVCDRLRLPQARTSPGTRAGLSLWSSDRAAEQARGAIFQRMSEFMAGYDPLLCLTACVAPFDVSTRWIREVSGVTFDNYVEWLRITSAITSPVPGRPCRASHEEACRWACSLVGRPRGVGAAVGGGRGRAGVRTWLVRAAGFQGRLSVVGRFAPSPSGLMHGKRPTALLAWLTRGRAEAGCCYIEDGPRPLPAEYAQAIRDDLTRLGLDGTRRPGRTAARPGLRLALSGYRSRAGV